MDEDSGLIVYNGSVNIISYPIALYDKSFTDRFIYETTKSGGYRYSLSSYNPSLLNLPIILNIALFKPSESAISLTIAIEFPEDSNLLSIESTLILANAPYNQYSQNFIDHEGNEIPGNKVIEIYYNTLEGIASLRNLYFQKHQDSTYLLEIILAPMVDWLHTKEDHKWKEKIELWFSSWADKPSTEVYKALSNAKCILIENNHSIAVIPYSSDNTLEFYSEQKVKQIKIKELYNSLSKEDLNSIYHDAIVGTIESKRQWYFREFTKEKITKRYIDKKLHNLEECLNIFTLNHNNSTPILKGLIHNMHELISSKEANYEIAAKNAKDLSTLTGVASDLIIDPALTALKTLFPVVGVAASLIKGAIFYGISLTKTASCGYSFINRNFNSGEKKITYEDQSKKLITGLICKSTLCAIDKFVLLGKKDISILEEIFGKIASQVNVDLGLYELTNRILDSLGNGSYIAENIPKYSDNLLYLNGSNSVHINDYFSYDSEVCYSKLLSLNYSITMEE